MSAEIDIHHYVKECTTVEALTLEDVRKDNIVISSIQKYATTMKNTKNINGEIDAVLCTQQH